jgi:hypothetical protein
MTRYFIDCEFIEDGKTIDLISIGIVCEDGREYYAQSCEFDPSKADDWVKENVFPHLKVCPHYGSPHESCRFFHNMGQCMEAPGKFWDQCPWRGRTHMRHEILTFMNTAEYGTPELWGYYSAYDHVAVCQLFGTMMDLPQAWPMYTKDLKQWSDQLGCPELPPQEEDEHNALADARHNKSIWSFLNVCEDLRNNYGAKFRK